MIKPYYELLGRQIPAYGLFFYLGIALAAGSGMLLCRRKGTPRFDLIGSAVYTLIGAFLGAKLLFICVSAREIVALKLSFIDIWRGGFVFYGGLLGGILGMWGYAKQFKYSMRELAETYAAVLPLGHALGRVGCFFAGCCYGIPHSGILGYTYTETLASTPIGVPLLPVQLIESAFLLILFFLLLLIYLKTGAGLGYTVPTYLLLYAPLRFVLEFFRGDRERGVLLLSTSQWISLGIAATGLVLLGRKISETQKTACED